jgi:hypothetical protein
MTQSGRRLSGPLVLALLNVRFGSKADIASQSVHVRFTPESGHHTDVTSCPLCAIGGHQQSHNLEACSTRAIMVGAAERRAVRTGISAAELWSKVRRRPSFPQTAQPSTKGAIMKQFLKTTLVGGVLFLLPVALIIILLGRAMTLSTKGAKPIAEKLGLDNLGYFHGIGAVTVLSVLMLVMVSFAAGLLARTKLGGRISGWFESSFLANVPYY